MDLLRRTINDDVVFKEMADCQIYLDKYSVILQSQMIGVTYRPTDFTIEETEIFACIKQKQMELYNKDLDGK
jgi:hypothetical protein